MDYPLVNLLALAALVFYPPIPLVIIFIHRTISFWRKLGVKSYTIFISLFGILYFLLVCLVFHFKEAILSFRIYDSPLAWVGLLPLIGGVVMSVFVIRALSLRVLLGIPEIFQIPTKLVMNGIYHYIRHPRYLEFILEILGIAIFSGLVWNFILFIFFVPAAFLMAYLEEKELVLRFGHEYLAYKKKTGWFLPFL